MLINESIVTKHAEDAAFLWPQRDNALRSNLYTDRDLRRLDDRLAANLEGLLLAGEGGWEICRQELLRHGDEGEVFSAGVLALASRTSERLESVLAVAFRSDDCARALVAAIAWHPFANVEPLLRGWLSASSAFLRYLSIAGYAAHRRAPATDWSVLLDDASEGVQRSALLAVGALGRIDALPAVRRYVEHPRLAFDACTVLAQSSAADDAVLDTLFAYLGEPSRTYRAALALALATSGNVSAYVRACQSARNTEGAIALMEASGEPTWMPSLIRLMSDEARGHLAGEALRTITGADLEQNDLTRARESASTDDAEARQDLYLVHETRLALPSDLAVARWWRAHERELEPGVRYLAGMPIAAADREQESAALREIVSSARPRQRSMAAHWLAARAPGTPRINTHAFISPQHIVPGWSEARAQQAATSAPQRPVSA